MLIRSHSAPEQLEPLAHGGDLAAARQMFPDAPEPFIDLSTGINPHPYPLPALPPEIFARLPDRAGIRRLAAVAAQAYGAPSADHVVPAPGTQILLPQVAMLVPPGRAAILRTDLRRARARGGAGRTQRRRGRRCRGTRTRRLAIVVNPNNPDGRIVPKAALLTLADELPARGGILVVDEAFADVAPGGASLAGDVGRGNIVVLRSFGKFFGLAGLRLGFAIAAPNLIARLDAMLGPWAVSAARPCSSAKRRWPTRPGRSRPSRACRSRRAARSMLSYRRRSLNRRRHVAVPADAIARRGRAVHASRPRRHPGPPLRRTADVAALGLARR